MTTKSLRRSIVRMLVLVTALAACAGKQGTPTTSGNGSNISPPAGGCDAVRGRVEQLYRAEAQAKEPTRVDEAVADNTRMVMLECAKSPDQVSACLAKVATVKELETTCLPALDDEGTETDVLRK